MFGVISRELVRVGDGTVSPSAGLAGLLAAPVPQDETLQARLACLSPAALPGLLDRIAFHRIDGLAYRAVSRLPRETLDPWLRSSLKRRAQGFAAATLSQALALAEILEALAHASIPVVVMRGVRTVEAIYGDPALRPFEDHDLLVLPEDRDAARGILLHRGYEEQVWGLFRRGGVIVDLHVDPLGARRRPSRQALFPVPVRSLFARAIPGLVAGAPSLLLQPEDDLLLLAIHLVKHSFDRLVRVADVAHFVHRLRASLDWSLLFRRAEACGAVRLVGWAIEAAAVLGAALRAVDLPAPAHRGPLERLLMARVLDVRPLPYTGEALMAMAAPTLQGGLLFLLDALWPAGERPDRAWRATAALPRRVFDLAKGGASRVAERKRM
jgi:hypothetical protein